MAGDSHIPTRTQTHVQIHSCTDACRKDSPKGCRAVGFSAPGYSSGALLKIHGGHEVSKSTDLHSCPEGFKIWSPRTKKDWTIVYNAMGKDKTNYPSKPSLIIDVTQPTSNTCGGCASQAMNSNNAAQSVWQTFDASDWWLRDSASTAPTASYDADCFLGVDKVAPDDVQFKANRCALKSKDYLCQPMVGGMSSFGVVVILAWWRLTMLTKP